LRAEARPEVRPFKWIGAKVSRRLAGSRGANRNCDGRIEAVLLSSVPSFFWHRVKRDGLLVKMNKASAVPVLKWRP